MTRIFQTVIACLLFAAVCSAGRAAEIIVAADGSGQFTTVQAAVNAAPPGSAAQPTVIHIKPGTYKEQIVVPPEKRGLRLIGENALMTVLTDNRYASLPGPDGKPLGTYRTASTTIEADDFTAENLTFENAAGPKGQALAIRLDGDRAAFHRCRFFGWQDTLLTNHGRHYFRSCAVYGFVDFIFGAGTAVFDRCDLWEIRDTGGVLTAPGTSPNQAYGLVFLNCRLDSLPNIKPGSTGLMRPWREYGAAAFINCVMDADISTLGWDAWNGREKTCRAIEYGSRMPAGKRVDLSLRAPWVQKLTDAEAAAYTPGHIFGDWNPVGK